MKTLMFVLSMVLFISCTSNVIKEDQSGILATGSSNLTLSVVEHKSDSAKLKWTYSGPNPYCFRILKKIDALSNPSAPAGLEKYAVIAKLDGGVRTFIDENVSHNDSLNYRIRTCRDESLNGGNYSNFAGSNTANGLTAPKLIPPVMVGEDVEVNWISKAAATGGVTSFNIYRKANVLDQLGSPIATVSATLGVDSYSYTDSTCPQNGYFIYVIEAIGSQGASLSEQIGLGTGVVAPGIITNFSALYMSTSDSIASMNSSSPHDVILEWRYAGNPCIFVFKMRSGSKVAELKDFSSTNRNISTSFNSYIARIPYAQVQNWVEEGVTSITFEIYPLTSYAGNVVTTTLNIAQAPSLNAAASTLSASGSGQNLSLVLDHNYAANGFITAYGVQRRDCGTSFSSCASCAAPVTVLSGRQFITSLSGVKPSFTEYYGSSNLSLQRVDGHEYCYSFVLSNGYTEASTAWSHH